MCWILKFNLRQRKKKQKTNNIKNIVVCLNDYFFFFLFKIYFIIFLKLFFLFIFFSSSKINFFFHFIFFCREFGGRMQKLHFHFFVLFFPVYHRLKDECIPFAHSRFYVLFIYYTFPISFRLQFFSYQIMPHSHAFTLHFSVQFVYLFCYFGFICPIVLIYIHLCILYTYILFSTYLHLKKKLKTSTSHYIYSIYFLSSF